MRRYTDAENCFGDVMPDTILPATVSICPARAGDQHLQLRNYGSAPRDKVLYSKTLAICATTTNTEVTACYITVPSSSVVYVNMTAAWGCSGGVGTDEASGGHINLTTTLVGSACVVSKQEGQIARTGVASAVGTVTLDCCAMNPVTTTTLASGVSPVVINGIASQAVTWGILIETITVYTEHNPNTPF